MTLPRQVLPGSTYLLTRRCSQRQLLLRPSPLTNQVFLYCLAYAARSTGILVHAVTVMSNHWHVVLTDPLGRLPELAETVHKLTAKCINASLGRWENLWSSEPYSAVRLETEADVLDKVVYVLANPVSAGLVRTTTQWPGLRTTTHDFGRCLQAHRPEVFFRPGGPMPEREELRIDVPPAFAHLEPDQFGKLVAERLAEVEAAARRHLVESGRRFLGAQRVLDQSPFDRPRTREPRRGLAPKVACRDRWRRIEALGRIKAFLAAYAQAWASFKAGLRDVLFPAGTYWLVRHVGVPCASPS